MKIFRFLLEEFVYNGHLQSLGGVGVVFVASELLFGKKAGPGLLIMVYLTLQLIYVYDRYRDIEKDQPTNVERTRHLRAYWRYMPLMVLAMLACVLSIIVVYANLLTLVVTGTVVVLGLMYPIYFKGLTRKIYLFKNFYVALVYALFMFYPIAYYAGEFEPSSHVWFVFFYIIVEMVICQIALDLKDSKSDKIIGFLTLPVVLGDRQALTVLKVLIVGSILIFGGVGYLSLSLSAFWVIILVFDLVWNFLTVFYIQKREKRGFFLAASKFFGWLGIGIIVKMFI